MRERQTLRRTQERENAMSVIPLRKDAPPPAALRRQVVSRITGLREWSAGRPISLLAASDGSVEFSMSMTRALIRRRTQPSSCGCSPRSRSA